jgi:hypothetical protein
VRCPIPPPILVAVALGPALPDHATADDLAPCTEDAAALAAEALGAGEAAEASVWASGDGVAPVALEELAAALGCALPDLGSGGEAAWADRFAAAAAAESAGDGSPWAMLLPSIELRWRARWSDVASADGGHGRSAGGLFEIWMVWSGPVGWP